jgi:hypothetical protein
MYILAIFFIHRMSLFSLIRGKPTFFEYLMARAIFYLQLAISPSVLIK